MHEQPTTIAEADELIVRVKHAMNEAHDNDHTLITAYSDELRELEAHRSALLPGQRKSS